MTPITFSCEETLPLAPEDIARQILDLTKWPDFHGYGPIPGINTAVFDTQTPGVIGTRIRVTNLDGSSHVEEIVEWQPDRRVRLAYLAHEHKNLNYFRRWFLQKSRVLSSGNTVLPL